MAATKAAAAKAAPAATEEPAAAEAAPVPGQGQHVVRDGRYGVVVGYDPDEHEVTVVWLVGPHEQVPADQVEAVS